DASVRALPTSEQEIERTIYSALISGPEIIVLDNLDSGSRGQINSATLAAILTARTLSSRVIRTSTAPSVPVDTMFILTGNGVLLSKELARRVLMCRIVPSVENPQFRNQFRHSDIIAWTKENRGHLIWALLVLARASVAAGLPYSGELLGSFEAYCRVI